MTDHTYGTCVHKLFSDVNEDLRTKYDEHQESVINFKNNETELNDELMANFTKEFERNMSGIVQIKHLGGFNARIVYQKFDWLKMSLKKQ